MRLPIWIIDYKLENSSIQDFNSIEIKIEPVNRVKINS